MKFFLNARNRDILFIVLAMLLVLLYVIAGGGHFALDDGWIHQTFARNLADSGQWAFIPGQQTAASTSPLYTVLLSIGYRLNIQFLLWAHFLGVIALASTALIGARITEKIIPESSAAPLITGLALLLTWHHIWAAASGMETILFGMFTLLLMYLTVGMQHAVSDTINKSSAVIFGIVAALTTLTRPEGALLVAICGLILLLIHSQGTFLKTLLWGIVAGVVFLIVMTPYLILNFQLTGGILPDTASAKFIQHEVLLQLPLTARLQNLTLAIFAGGQILLLPGIMIYVFSLFQREKIKEQLLYTIPLLWGAGLLLLYAVRLPADYQHGRYVIPALPALVTTGTIGTMILLHWAQPHNSNEAIILLKRVFSRALAMTVIAVYLIFAFFFGVQAYQRDVAIINEEMVMTALWIDANLPDDDLLAIHDIGAVGYFAERPELLDIAGLVSPEVIPIIEDDNALWALMQAEDARYLMGFPDQLPGQNPSDARLCRIYISNGQTSQRIGGPGMAIYRLAWDSNCDT